MSTGHSWKWLAPRLNAEQVRSFARAAAAADDRPCLPMVEALGDRILFATDINIAPSPLSGILIGLITGEIKGETKDGVQTPAILDQQGALLKLAGAQLERHIDGVKWEDFHKFAPDVAGFDDPVYKFVEDIVSGRSPSVKKAHAELESNYQKIQPILKKIDGSGEVTDGQGVAETLAKAIFHAADNLLISFGDGSHVKIRGDYKLYSMVVNTLGDATNGALKIEADIIANKATNADKEFLKIKLQDILVSSARLMEIKDSDGAAAVDGAKTAIESLVAEVLKTDEGKSGGGGGAGGQFDGGVTSSDNTNDILK